MSQGGPASQGNVTSYSRGGAFPNVTQGSSKGFSAEPGTSASRGWRAGGGMNRSRYVVEEIDRKNLPSLPIY